VSDQLAFDVDAPLPVDLDELAAEGEREAAAAAALYERSRAARCESDRVKIRRKEFVHRGRLLDINVALRAAGRPPAGYGASAAVPMGAARPSP
jgi:hypothetical protein